MRLALFYCFMAALCYSIYPVLAKKMGLTGIWVAIMINTGGLMVALIKFGSQTNKQMSSIKQMLIGFLLIGIVAGVGTLFYSEVMVFKGIDVSKLIPITLALMPIMTAILAYFIMQEQVFTIKKITAFTMAAVSIYLLSS